ncbi:YjbH domain-containing protein [Desulfovulcanus sp.]
MLLRIHLTSYLPSFLTSFLILFTPFTAQAWVNAKPQALASIQSYTGIWDIPNARVLPDWHMRFKISKADVYDYYGGAIGLLDRLEIAGQITEINTIPDCFGPNAGYGEYKDRSAGARLVLIQENDFWPQIAIGFYDVTGTALFGQRYLVASKMFGPFDLTLGLGQGILAGENTSGTSNTSQDSAFDFLTSSPARKTDLFGGIEYHFDEDLTFSAEYSPIKYEKLKGGREKKYPINFGLKYKLVSWFHLQAAYMRGEDLSLGVNFQFPLEPEGFLAWKKEKPFLASERLRWQAFEADDKELAEIIASQVKKSGFSHVAVGVYKDSLWIEAVNAKYLSNARALARIFFITEQLTPERISIFYLNLKNKGQILLSLKAQREDVKAFLESRLDKEAFLSFADLDLYGDEHWHEFTKNKKIELARANEDWYDLEIRPRIKTLIEDPAGFFLHKAVVQSRMKLYWSESGMFVGELEHTLYNDFKKATNTTPLEDDPAATGWMEYEERSGPRISMCALDQTFDLPWDNRGRISAGYFESAYAGLGAETFRYFHDGLWGVGLECELVRKRDTEDNFALRKDSKLFYTYFANIYAQIWPDQGLQAGLKLGRFLGGDKGARLELRRSFKYFKLGAWITKTYGGDFENPLNIGNMEKGVYISIPFSIFRDKEERGHFNYGITSFQRDAGQLVRQPNSLYPLNPWSTPDYTKRHLEDMRQ